MEHCLHCKQPVTTSLCIVSVTSKIIKMRPSWQNFKMKSQVAFQDIFKWGNRSGARIIGPGQKIACFLGPFWSLSHWIMPNWLPNLGRTMFWAHYVVPSTQHPISCDLHPQPVVSPTNLSHINCEVDGKDFHDTSQGPTQPVITPPTRVWRIYV